MVKRLSFLMLLAFAFARPAAAQQVTKSDVPGVANFARLETTVACGGATKPEGVPEIKKLGFASIINLRLPSEPGANVDAEAAAAQAAGIKFFSIPFSGQSPDPAVADKFLATLTTPGNEPAFIHWDSDRAFQEATALGLTSPALKQFAIDYAQSHKR